jgi:uncharacterized protein (DUF1697 family)
MEDKWKIRPEEATEETDEKKEIWPKIEKTNSELNTKTTINETDEAAEEIDIFDKQLWIEYHQWKRIEEAAKEIDDQIEIDEKKKTLKASFTSSSRPHTLVA